MLEGNDARPVRQRVITGFDRKIGSRHRDVRSVVGIRFDLQDLEATRRDIANAQRRRIYRPVGDTETC